MKHYLIKVDEPKRTVKKGKLVWIKTTCNEVVELTEEELTKLQTILMNEVGFHSNMKGGKKFEVMYDKIRKVLDNEKD